MVSSVVSHRGSRVLVCSKNVVFALASCSQGVGGLGGARKRRVRNRKTNTRKRNGGMSRQVKKFISRFGGVRNNTFNGIEQEFNSEKNSILLRAPPLFPKRRAAAGHSGITYESLHFRSLQSLASAEGVNGDGEPVDDDDDGSEDSEGNSGQNEVPAGSGAPVGNLLKRDNSCRFGADGKSGLAELSGH